MLDYNAIHNIYNEGYYANNYGILANISHYIPVYNLLSNHSRLYSIIGLINLAGYQFIKAGQYKLMDQAA